MERADILYRQTFLVWNPNSFTYYLTWSKFLTSMSFSFHIYKEKVITPT